VLTDDRVEVVYEEWDAARKALDVQVLAYAIMPDHFHAILWGEQGRSIRRFLQRTQGLTSHRLRPGGGFWKERPRVLPVYSRKVLETKVNYLHANPVRRGLVASPADWVHSSYRQVEQGLTDVPFLCDSWDVIAA
jgi:putative transposase